MTIGWKNAHDTFKWLEKKTTEIVLFDSGFFFFFFFK